MGSVQFSARAPRPKSSFNTTNQEHSKSIWNKISHFASNVFYFFCFWRSREVTLNKNQVTAIKKAKATVAAEKIKHKHTVTPLTKDQKVLSYKANPPEHFDDSIENFRNFIHDFTKIALECTFEEHLQGPLATLQAQTTEIPEVLKKIAKTVIDVGDVATKQIYIELAKQKKTEMLTAPLRSLLVFLKQGNQEEIKKALANLKPTKPLEAKHAEAVKEWLLDTDQTETLDAFFRTKNLKMPALPSGLDPLEATFQEAIRLLVEYKIDQYVDLLKKDVQENLSVIAKNFFETNGLKLTDIITERLGEIFSSMGSKFPEMFDGVAAQLNNQAEAIVKAQQTAEEAIKPQEKLIAKAEAILKDKKASSADKKASKDFLAKIRLIKEKMMLNTFAKQQAAHSGIRDIINNKEHQNNPELYVKGKEKILLREIADDLLKLVFEYRGKVDESEIIQTLCDSLDKEEKPIILGLVKLIEQIELPKELEPLVQDGKVIAQQVISSRTNDLIKQFKGPFIECSKALGAITAKYFIREATISALESLIDKFTHPENLNQLLSENVLPSMQRSMTLVLTRQVFERNIRSFAADFNALIQIKEKSEREKKIEEIKQKLYDKVKTHCSQFDIANEVPVASFSLIANPFISDLENLLKQLEKDHAFTSLEENEVIAILQQSFVDTNSDNNPLYGNLIHNVVFKIGKFGSFTQKIANFGFVKKKISGVIVSSLHDMRTSHQGILDTMVPSLRESFLSKDRVKELFASHRSLQELQLKKQECLARLAKAEEIEKLDKEIALVQKNLAAKAQAQVNIQTQMTRIAELSHDILMYNVGQKGFITKSIVKVVVGKNASHLDSVIKRCFQELLGENEILNQNLLFQIQKVILEKMLALKIK